MSARNALVVGGSGMLADLCRSLAADGWQVTVVGRDTAKLARATGGDGRLHALSVDYEDRDAFAAALAEIEHAPLELAVCWIRSWASEALRAAAAAVAPGGRLVHVIGSGRSNESDALIEELKRRDELIYQQVQLGAIVQGRAQRWLTNDEISAGVYAALQANRPYYRVGALVP